ncbi:MAG: hypothetical protein IT445_13005 [Phycisphaeraceae bacterium]|nr:hypothetical protein [Phycisphaeraceae bacterium]
MPPPPLIASTTGQRFAVAVAMAVLLVCSLAVAYTYSHADPAQHERRAAGNAGSIELSLGEQWQTQEPGPWAQLLPAATVFVDTGRATRQLVISPLANDQPIEPQQLTMKLLEAVAQGPTQVQPPHGLHDSRTGMTYYELYAYSQEADRVVMHLFAVVGGGGPDHGHVVLIYMRDAIDDEMMSRYDLLLFRSIYRSATLP